MSDRKRVYHVLKKNHRTSVPRRMLFLDTETAQEKVTGDETHHDFKLGHTIYVQKSRGKGLRWIEERRDHHEKKKLIRYVKGLLQQKQPLYIIGSNIFFDLMVSGFIKHFTRTGWKLKFCYAASMSFILICKKGSFTVKCLSTQNYTPYGVDKLAKVVGKKKLKVDFNNVTDEELLVYCRRDTEIVRDFMLKYLQFIIDNDMGRFSYTRASQAMALYRHRFMDYKIYIHDNPYASELEERCYYGGRSECFKIGDFTGIDLVYMDVNSMYPFIMHRDEFPVKLAGVTERPSLKWIEANRERYCFCAEVDLDTPEAEYAVRDKDRILFPIGRFKTFVCTYGLLNAIDKGHLRGIHKLAYYEKAPIFRRFVTFMHREKSRFKAAGEPVFEEMSKRIMNSLYGKFGQRHDLLVEETDHAGDDFHRESYFNHETQQNETVQVLFHKKQVFSGKSASNNTFYAVPAHVTEGARFHLSAFIEAVGRQNVYYMDTDSIVLETASCGPLGSYVGDFKLGNLEIEKITRSMIIRGCKDYQIGEAVKLKGVRKNAERLSDNTFRQDYFPGLNKVMREGIQDGIPVYKQVKRMKRIYTKGDITSDGTVRPFELPDQYPVFERLVSLSKTS